MSLKIKVLSFGLSLMAWSAAEAQFARIDHSRPIQIAGSDLYSTDISWSVGRGGNGIITVEVVNAADRNERGERLFACGDRGNQRADWIRGGDQYVFRLYEGPCPRSTFPSSRELGRDLADTVVEVRRHGGGHDPIGRSMLDAEIGRRQNPNGTLNAQIEWAISARRGTGVITVVVPGAQDPSERVEKLFACGNQGNQLANWIRPHGKIEFRLYEGRDCPRVGRGGLHPGDLGQMTERLVIVNGQVNEGGRGGRGGR